MAPMLPGGSHAHHLGKGGLEWIESTQNGNGAKNKCTSLFFSSHLVGGEAGFAVAVRSDLGISMRRLQVNPVYFATRTRGGVRAERIRWNLRHLNRGRRPAMEEEAAPPLQHAPV